MVSEEYKKYIANTYNRYPLVLEHGKGSVAYGADGKKYIDFGSGIAVNSFGFCDDELVSAVTKQLMQVQHASNYYYTEPQAKLSEMLCTRTGMSNVFFSNSGAEANECAIKVARKYSSDKYGDGRATVVTLKNSFHGRTLTTLSATGQEVFHKHFGPFTPGFRYAEANNTDDIKKAATSDVCAIMIEMIQGEGGINVLDKQFVDTIAELCGSKDILLIVDEIQTGNGRTGKLFCYEHYGIQPDIVSTAKGLAGGLPIGATLMGGKVKDVLGHGDHGSTFGGNPVSAAAAVSVLSRIDEKLLTEVTEKGSYITKELSECKNVISVSGMGLLLGAETSKMAAQIASECFDKGLLVLTAKNKVRLAPALNIPMEQIKEGLEILKGVIEV